MTDHNESENASSNANDYERVEDVEIETGEVYIDHTDADDRVYVVQGVGDVTEFAAEDAIPDEQRERIERTSDAVLVKSDKNDADESTALDARVFRRFVFQGSLRQVEPSGGEQ